MKQKILIVEDEALGAMGLMELLEMWDYETCGPAHTGEDFFQDLFKPVVVHRLIQKFNGTHLTKFLFHFLQAA